MIWQLSRRQRQTFTRFLPASALVILFMARNLSAETNSVSAEKSSLAIQRYQIAVCDWMILNRQKLGAFQLAKDIGADGVEVDMGPLGERETFERRVSSAEATIGKSLARRGRRILRSTRVAGSRTSDGPHRFPWLQAESPVTIVQTYCVWKREKRANVRQQWAEISI